MEWFSHYMYAFLLGRKTGVGKTEMRALLVGTILPDVDFIVSIWGLEYFRLYHKAFTHSIFTAPLLGLLLTGILFAVYKKNLIIPVMIGVYTHLLLDIFNLPKSTLEYAFPHASFSGGGYPMGTAFFWPLTSHKYSLHELLGGHDYLTVTIYVSVILGALSIMFFYMKKGARPWYPFLRCAPSDKK